MDDLIALDKKAFMFLNDLHAPWLDQPMYLISETLLWIPLYALLLYHLFKIYRSQAWLVLLGIALTILLADQITSGLMKSFFQRLRPSRDPSMSSLVHIVNGYRGGLYGFASSHAANTFGVATFIFLALRQTRTWIWILFLWALVVTYSRIYLGVHYPGDILVGGLIGAVCGITSFRLTDLVRRRYLAGHPTSG